METAIKMGKVDFVIYYNITAFTVLLIIFYCEYRRLIINTFKHVLFKGNKYLYAN